MNRIRRYVAHRSPSRRAKAAMIAMFASTALLLAGLGMETFNLVRSERMATISMTCSLGGLIGGITSYVVTRYD